MTQQKDQWWQVTVTHFVPESDDGVNWEEWEDLKESMDRRREE